MDVKHKPMPESVERAVLSAAKTDFWETGIVVNGVKQTKLSLFHYAMAVTTRPTAPNESIAAGYTRNAKLHDGEPSAIYDALEALYDHFFDLYPSRTPDRGLSKSEYRRKCCAAIGECAQMVYKGGKPSYGKPGLRKDGDSSPGLPKVM